MACLLVFLAVQDFELREEAVFLHFALILRYHAPRRFHICDQRPAIFFVLRRRLQPVFFQH